jgi:peptidoglycan hydrolase CwlO-like protein
MQRWISLSLSIFILLITLAAASLSFAAVCEGQDDCKNKIKEYEEKLQSARTQTGNLSSQLKFMDTKIELAQINIKKTEDNIDETQTEIDKLSNKIEELNTSLDHLSRVLLEKIVDGYKRREMSMLEVLLAPNNSSFANRLQYIQTVQENDQMLALRTQQIKNNFVEQKSIREVKKEELEELENQLKQQKVELDGQKAQKTELLQQTKTMRKNSNNYYPKQWLNSRQSITQSCLVKKSEMLRKVIRLH